MKKEYKKGPSNVPCMTPESTCTSSVVDSLPSMITCCVRQDIGNSRSNWGYDLFLFHRTPVSVGVSWGAVCRMHWRDYYINMFPGCHTSGERKDIVMMIELVLQDLRTARVRILFSCAFLKVSWIFYLSSISVVLFFSRMCIFLFF